MSTSPSGSRTVWGTPAIVGTPDAAMVAQPRSSADDGWLKDVEVLEERGDPDLAFQMEALGLAEPAAATVAAAAGGSVLGPGSGAQLLHAGPTEQLSANPSSDPHDPPSVSVWVWWWV